MRDEPSPFRYFRDPLCVASLALYVLNRWLLKPYDLGGTLSEKYLNDLLCLPLFLPMILYTQRRLGLRRHDAPPRLWEVLQHWLVFSVVFEMLLPRLPNHFRSTADPLDVLAYLVGGLVGWVAWSGALKFPGRGIMGRRGYRRCPSTNTPASSATGSSSSSCGR